MRSIMPTERPYFLARPAHVSPSFAMTNTLSRPFWDSKCAKNSLEPTTRMRASFSSSATTPASTCLSPTYAWSVIPSCSLAPASRMFHLAMSPSVVPSTAAISGSVSPATTR